MPPPPIADGPQGCSVCRIERVFFLEDHLFFAQALSLTLGAPAEAVLATTLAEGGVALGSGG